MWLVGVAYQSFFIDFPDLFMNVIPRPGDERTYMRPLVESAEMLQPNLDMLNPSLDDLLDHLEPMEGIGRGHTY